MKKKRTIRDNVEEILRDYPYTRNSDKKLIIKYWEIVDKISMNSIDEFLHGFMVKATNPESIRRARQLIQEEGKYLPTDPTVLERRRKKQYLMKESIKKHRQVV
jgi:hypothetical protein